MGGHGSGQYYRWGKRDTTGDTSGIDVRWLARKGMLTWGLHSLSWSRGGKEVASIRYVIADRTTQPEALVLHYRALIGGEWRDVREPVELEWTDCTYGGRRPWFLCPGFGCGRRVALIYLGGGYFRCRHCLQLVYESQRENAGGRGLTKAQAIRRRLGGSANMTLPFPPKPPRMHWRTYWRLRREADAAEAVYDVAICAWLAKTDAWLNQRYGDLLRESPSS